MIEVLDHYFDAFSRYLGLFETASTLALITLSIKYSFTVLQHLVESLFRVLNLRYFGSLLFICH